MKKLILLALTALMMVGCNVRPRTCYVGDSWDVLVINDSTYLIIPKYKEYNMPYVLNVKDEATADSARNVGKRN